MVLAVIRNFLWYRRQQVRVQVASGVPQGSVFGPVLFITYFNDLPRDIITLLFLLADDTKLMQKLISTTPRNKLQDDINRPIEWSKKWELKFNTLKRKFI